VTRIVRDGSLQILRAADQAEPADVLRTTFAAGPDLVTREPEQESRDLPEV